MQELYLEIELKMKHAVDHLHEEMKHLRTGRASLTLLDGITIDYYGTPSPLNQVANLTVADATLIVIQPYDASLIPEIEKAIVQSPLGLNPGNDGKIVRVPVPPLTEERRQEIVRQVHEQAENARNAVRHARREGNDRLKAMEREKEIGQDDEHRGHEEMQRLHDHYIGLVNTSLAKKEEDILTV